MDLAEGARALVSQFDLAPEKAELLRRIVAVQQTLPAPSAYEADVYVSIPFCRTRCVYCSFPGEALGRGRQVDRGHGATVGQLDQNALFYLRSRGIDAREAKLMLMFGFAHDVIKNIPIEALRDRIDHLVLQRLRGELSRCASCAIQCN